jgi:hypothetical protein
VAKTAMWVHGNALAVQSPESLEVNGRLGWGADLRVRPGKSTWLHIPVPTPVIIGEVRASLMRVFLLFDARGGRFTAVHVWDGVNKVQQFDGLDLSGNHVAVDGVNTFKLDRPHRVVTGIGVSAVFTAPIGFDTSIAATRLIVAAAGADFEL